MPSQVNALPQHAQAPWRESRSGIAFPATWRRPPGDIRAGGSTGSNGAPVQPYRQRAPGSLPPLPTAQPDPTAPSRRPVSDAWIQPQADGRWPHAAGRSMNTSILDRAVRRGSSRQPSNPALPGSSALWKRVVLLLRPTGRRPCSSSPSPREERRPHAGGRSAKRVNLQYTSLGW